MTSDFQRHALPDARHTAPRAFIICPDEQLTDELERVGKAHAGIEFIRIFTAYPQLDNLLQLLRVYVPSLVFVSAESMADVDAIYRLLQQEAPNARLIAIHGSCEPELLLALMRKGIQEFMAAPLSGERSIACLMRVTECAKQAGPAIAGTDRVYAFLPAKQGVGTTTVAVNTAMNLVKNGGGRAFLGDFDLNGGMLRFLLKLHNQSSVLEAAEHAGHLDEKIWTQLVSTSGNLDVIHSGTLRPDIRIDPFQVRRLMEFLRRYYKVVCADLSGNMEKFSLEIMRESKHIFLVTTPELPALHLAREKQRFLSDLDLGDRIAVVVNRWNRDALVKRDDIERIVGRPIHMTFPNEYRGVHRSVSEGKPVAAGTAFAKQCMQLAGDLSGGFKVEKRPMRFTEYFSALPQLFRQQPG